MADVLLREYIEQLREHLRAGRYSDAFTLGQHILHSFPKHLETYCLLAQASLETDDLAGAADLFRRVLSADPENVMALVGMAVISEAREQMEEALWYLERAYELQPFNPELRRELGRVRESYLGTAPERVELTPGALARLYMRQGQYAHAIAEFRRLLKQDAKRYDLQVGLTEALFRAERADEAGKLAQNVLAEAPYCLKANLILGALLAENGVVESEQFMRRAQQLDPENRVAAELIGGRFAHSPPARLPPLGTERTLPSPTEPEWLATIETIAPSTELSGQEREPVESWLRELETGSSEKKDMPLDEKVDLVARLAVAPTTADFPISREPSPAQAPEGEFGIAAQLDRTGQPAPGLRTHPSLPKVRPVIPGASERIPTWLRIAPTAGSLETPPTAAPPTVGERHVLPTEAPSDDATSSQKPISPVGQPRDGESESTRPAWLIEAEAVAKQEAIAPEETVPLPSWLVSKPETESADKKAAPRTAAETEIPLPDWMRSEAEQPPSPSAAAGETLRKAESMIALPSWLADESKPEAPPASTTPELAEPEEIQGWSSAETADRPTPETRTDRIQDIVQEPPFVRAQEAAPIAPSSDWLPPEPSPLSEIPSAPEVPSAAPKARADDHMVPRPEMGELEPPAQPLDQVRSPVKSSEESAALLAQARARGAEGDWKAALDLYERVMHRRPNFLDEVIHDLEALVQLPEAPLTAHRVLGEAYAMAGRFKESLEQYRIAMAK